MVFSLLFFAKRDLNDFHTDLYPLDVSRRIWTFWNMAFLAKHCNDPCISGFIAGCTYAGTGKIRVTSGGIHILSSGTDNTLCRSLVADLFTSSNILEWSAAAYNVSDRIYAVGYLDHCNLPFLGE